MSIKLRFESGSLVVVASLKDDALGTLLKLVSEHQSGETLPVLTPLTPRGDAGGGGGSQGDTHSIAAEWLSRHSAAEVLNLIGWDKNTDKILLLGAYHEEYSPEGAKDGWKKGDLEARYAEAKEGVPGNLSRDIGVAIKDGLLAPVTQRTYKVSRTGWNKIAAAINAEKE